MQGVNTVPDRVWCCSLTEADLWDYVITNDTMESTGKQLDDISGRALAGQIGNGIATLEDSELASSSPTLTVCPSLHGSHFCACNMFRAKAQGSQSTEHVITPARHRAYIKAGICNEALSHMSHASSQ